MSVRFSQSQTGNCHSISNRTCQAIKHCPLFKQKGVTIRAICLLKVIASPQGNKPVPRHFKM